MEININLDNDFQKQLKKLKEKYGEEITRVNGFSDEQLDYTNFIDNFVSGGNVANVTIDPNANASTKDIRGLLDEMNKPHAKLLSFNKIYYEMKKKHGKKLADKWLEDEFSGALYLHDASSASFYSYCIKPQETCYYIYQGQTLHGNFDDIYNMLPEKETYLPEMDTYAKYPRGLRVQDKGGWTTVKRICWHKNKDKEMRFVGTRSGQDIITTEDHVFFDEKGNEIAANSISKSDKLDLVFKKDLFTNSITKWCDKELTYDVGWLVGFVAVEGMVSKRGNLISLSQSAESMSHVKRFANICDSLNIKYRVYDHTGDKTRIVLYAGNQQRNGSPKYSWLQFITSVIRGNRPDNRHLTPEYINFDNNFLIGFFSGLLDKSGTTTDRLSYSLAMPSRTMINQVSAILLANGIKFIGEKPYIRKYKKDTTVKQNSPVYGIRVSKSVLLDFVHECDDKLACRMYNITDSQVAINDCTYNQDIVYDLTTETGSFVCNNIRVHNCYAYELQNLAERGLYFLPKSNTSPAKHMSTFFAHIREFIVWVSNRSAGACALPSFFIYSYYFWKKDTEDGYYLKNPEYYRRQLFQQFIFEVNQIHTRIVQSAYTNLIIMDRHYIIELFGDRVFPDGTLVIDCVDEIIEHQKVFMEVAAEIRHNVFHTFPVFTYALLFQEGKFQDEEFARWCNKHNLQWYDSNFYIGDSVTTLASCCRMLNEISKQKHFQSSIGGSLVEIGSVKVSTVNLMRVALECNNDKDKFIEILKERIALNMTVLDCVRGIIKRNIEKGLLPNYTYGVINLEKQTTTNGLTAMYEAIQHLGLTQCDEFGNVSYTDEGIGFACKIMDTVNEMQDNAGYDYNVSLEIIPAESANVKLCKKDTEIYGDQGYFIYSNQWTSLMEQATIDQRIKLSSILDKKAGGGQILHISLDGGKLTEEASWNLLNHIAKSGVIYFAFNPKLSLCNKSHTFFGDICPVCGGAKVDEATRIVGYLVPTSTYTSQRKEEYYNRKWYTIGDDIYSQ